MRSLMIALVVVGISATVVGGASASAANAILINFTSPHCAPCQAMKPMLAQLERSGVPVRHVDVTSESALAQRYGIRKTPTFVVISGGKELTRLVGIQSAEKLQSALATNASGPLVPTHAKARGINDIPAPRTRLAPSRSLRSGVSFESRAQSRAQSLAPRASLETLTRTSDQSSAARSEAMPSLSLATAVQRAQAATVRLRVHDGHGYGAGTGTIIDVHGDEALVLTCGHLFRDTKGKGKIEVDLFVGGETRTVEGQVLDYDADDRDIALVTIRPGYPLQAVQVLRAGDKPRVGQTVFSFGCDRGDAPSRRDTRITGVDKYNQHLGSSNVEISGAPIDGRSGGGLFDDQGRLIGVCNAADYKNDVGIYAGPGNVYWQLDRVKMSALYQSPRLDTPSRPSRTASVVPVSLEQPVGFAPPRNFDSKPTASKPTQRLAALAPTSPRPAGQPGVDQEVIVIVRDRNRPSGPSQVMTLREPTAALMQMIQQQAR